MRVGEDTRLRNDYTYIDVQQPLFLHSHKTDSGGEAAFGVPFLKKEKKKKKSRKKKGICLHNTENIPR